MRFLKSLLIGLALVVAAFAVVFPLANGLRKWDDWWPWAKLDPNARVMFAGPPVGPRSSSR